MVTPQESLEKRALILLAVLWGLNDVMDTALQEPQESSMPLQRTPQKPLSGGGGQVPRPPVDYFRKSNLPAYNHGAQQGSAEFWVFLLLPEFLLSGSAPSFLKI